MSTPTRKSLYTDRIDVPSSERMWSERYNLETIPDYCVRYEDYTHDIYGRRSHPLALPYGVRMTGMCNNLSPYYNVQAVLRRENALDRPYIPIVETGVKYDTMGRGRAGIPGATWHSSPAQKAVDLVPSTPPPPMQNTTDSSRQTDETTPMKKQMYMGY